MVKVAAQASGDCVWLLESKTHGIHRLASAAHHPLQRDEEEEIHSDGADLSDPSVSLNRPRGAWGLSLNTDHYRQRALARF